VEEPYSYQILLLVLVVQYTFFGRLMSLKQNILSAIKVMKGRASKKEEEEQERSRRGFAVFQYIQKDFFFLRYCTISIYSAVTGHRPLGYG
jgi:hypothetical protein